MIEKIRKAKDRYESMPVMLKASAWFLVCSFLQRGINAISTPIFTRIMTTAEYGNYDVFNSWLSIATEIVCLQLYAGVYMQGLVKFDEKREEFSSAIQGLTLTLVLGWTVLYSLTRPFWNGLLKLTTVQVYAMLVMIWATAVFNLWAGEQRVLYKYRILVIVTLIVSFLKPAISIVFVILAEDKVTARILGIALVELIGYMGLFIVQMKRGKKFFSGDIWKYALLFNIPLLPHYLSQHVLHSADRIMIKHYVGESQAGIYGLAYDVSQIMKLFNNALTSTITPYIYQKIKAGRVKDIAKVAYIGLPGIAIVNLMLMIFAPEVIAVFAPAEYYDAIWVIPAVTMSVYFTFAYDFFAKFSLYYEKTRIVMLASMSGAILNIVLNAIFIPKFGYYAAGYTTLICYAFFVAAHYYGMKWVCNHYLEGQMPYDMRLILFITAAFIASGFAIMATYNYPVIRYLVAAAALIVMIIFRKKILGQIKLLMSIKKNKEEN
jgi:O-antigen/teichoic acid export membrane protein